MHILFNDIHIQLSTSERQIQAQWARFFAGWPQTPDSPPQITLNLELADTLPDLPAQPPFFSDSHRYPGENGILDVYQLDDEHVLLHFLDGAQIKVPLIAASSADPLIATGTITPTILQNGRFIDITYTSLAPLLRRHDYFMIHAFAATQNGRTVLIVGPSGSGKTTTGLSLILAGWQLLANDVLLIQNSPEGLMAYPTPDDVTIRPKTFTLLPKLAQYVPAGKPLDKIVDLVGNDLTNGRWAKATLIDAIYMPRIETREASEKRPLSRAVCLAQMMEESIDKWDAQTLPDHINTLQALVNQAKTYTLHLGIDVGNLPILLSEK
jgi:hypothetical protein